MSLFLEADLSQGESRIVRVLTKAPRLIEIARSKPWEYDDHKAVASGIFKKPATEITKQERDLGKRTNHAASYGMRGRQFSDNLLKDSEGTLVIPPDECQRMIDAHLGANPEIVAWQATTRQEVLAKGMLMDSWGHRLSFAYEPPSDDLYRRAYAARPQGDLAKLMNQCGLKPLHRAIKANAWKAAINATVHDSLLVSCANAVTAWAVYQLLLTTLQIERDYYGVMLSIPIEVKLGGTWGTMTVEFKKPATKEAFWSAWEALEPETA